MVSKSPSRGCCTTTSPERADRRRNSDGDKPDPAARTRISACSAGDTRALIHCSRLSLVAFFGLAIAPLTLRKLPWCRFRQRPDPGSRGSSRHWRAASLTRLSPGDWSRWGVGRDPPNPGQTGASAPGFLGREFQIRDTKTYLATLFHPAYTTKP